jgi:hypothetical protein
MVESIEPVLIERIGLANTNAGQDNNIVVFKEKIQDIRNKATSKRKIQELWDVKSHWKLVEKVQAMVDDEENHETSKENNDCEECKSKEIWEDELSMMVITGSQFPIECGEKEKSRVNKRILHYY